MSKDFAFDKRCFKVFRDVERCVHLSTDVQNMIKDVLRCKKLFQKSFLLEQSVWYCVFELLSQQKVNKI